MDALRLPPGDAEVDQALRRRAPPRGAVPAAAARTRPAAARRAHQPPRRRVGGVARALPARLPRHRRGHHPRPLLPRQRGRLDPRARPRQGHPLRGQLLRLARAEAGAPRARRRRPESARASAPSQHELEWVRMAPKARQAKGKARLAAYEQAARRVQGRRGPRRQARDLHPVRATASATWSSRPSTSPRASATGCSSRTSPSRCPRPASSASSAPTAPARPPCSGCSPASEEPDDGAHQGRAHRRARLRRPEPRRPRRRQDRLRGDHRRPRRPRASAAARSTAGPTWRRSTSRAPTSRRRSACSPAASATACTWPRCSRTGGNVLLLDEPTNDLDVDTLRALEDGARGLRRLRGGHQPRPLVPRPHRHPHARLRGRLARCAGSRATSASTRPSARRSSAPRPTSPTASSTSPSPARASPPPRLRQAASARPVAISQASPTVRPMRWGSRRPPSTGGGGERRPDDRTPSPTRHGPGRGARPPLRVERHSAGSGRARRSRPSRRRCGGRRRSRSAPAGPRHADGGRRVHRGRHQAGPGTERRRAVEPTAAPARRRGTRRSSAAAPGAPTAAVRLMASSIAE